MTGGAAQLVCAGSVLGVLCAVSLALAGEMRTFVRVSRLDPRYFELSDGRPYVPVGFNLVGPPEPDDLERVIRTMARNRINYCRVWLSLWRVEHRRAGEYDPERARVVDTFLKLARSHGVRAKMCIEHFRDIPAEKRRWSDRPMYHEANGGPFRDMNDFLESERGISMHKAKLRWYANRYGSEPAVFAWELWNEMNCVRGRWLPWTKTMLGELHRLFPKNLCLQSLGSFDSAGQRNMYRRVCALEGNDVAQVHRYLDLGARLEVCHGPLDVLAADAVRELRSYDVPKPIILTEMGAVKPRHTGCSELYAKDGEGMLLHDMLFAPFFSGAAGPGHVWWWRQSIDEPNQWHHFARFAEAIDGIDPPEERFEPVMVDHDRLRVYALSGERTFIAWCRDARNDWRSELHEGIAPQVVSGVELDLAPHLKPRRIGSVRVYDPWNDSWRRERARGSRVALPPFRRSVILRVEYR